jgi:uncharacterized protein with HEPN domain
MPPDPRTYLWDAHRAASTVLEFIDGRAWGDYEADALLRSAVERQFEILGEALNKLRQVDPGLASKVPDIARLIAFRNVLIHVYASIDDRLVWDAAMNQTPRLVAVLSKLLSGL